MFSTAEDNQTIVELKLLFGERPLAAKNINLGKFQLTGIPPAPRGKPEVKVVLHVDRHCKLHVEASIDGTPLQASEDLTPPQKYLRESFLERIRADAEASKEQDEQAVSLIEARNTAELLIQQAEQRLASHKGKRSPGLDADAVAGAIASIGQALESGDVDKIRESTRVLQSSLEPEQGFDFSSFFGNPGFEALFAPQPNYKTRTTSNPAAHSRKTSHAQATSKGSHKVTQPLSRQSSLGKIFGGGDFTLDPNLCFVLMPFQETFKPIYEDHIRRVVQAAGLTCQRADEIHGTDLITRDIWEKINRARFLIADLTGQNPNVFYEVGLAHALGKDVLILTQTMTDVPFDLQGIRCLVYNYTPRGVAELESSLRATIATLMKSS